MALLLVFPWFALEGRLALACHRAIRFALYGGVALVLVDLVLARLPGFRHRVGLVLSCAGLLAAASLLTRAAQSLPSELACACAGTCSGYVAAALLRRTAVWRYVLAWAVTTIFVVLFLLPVGLVLADRVHARLSFPRMASFEGPSEVGRWWAHQTRLSRVTNQATHGRHALRVVAFKARGSYPGLFMTDGPRDWGGSGRLCFDVYLVGNAERSIWVRVDDRPDFPPYDDRAQTQVALVPGPNSICLELETLLRTPSGRALDRHEIRRWGIFFDEAQGGETIFLDHIRLVR